MQTWCHFNIYRLPFQCSIGWSIDSLTNPIMHQSHIPQYTTLELKCASTFLFQSSVFWVMGQMHSGIYEICLLGSTSFFNSEKSHMTTPKQTCYITGEGNFKAVYNAFNTWLNPGPEIEPQAAMIYQSREKEGILMDVIKSNHNTARICWPKMKENSQALTALSL